MEQPYDCAADGLPAFALGALDAEERCALADHLAACAVCRAEAQSYATVVALLGLTAPLAHPPPQLRQHLLAQIQEIAQRPAGALAPTPPAGYTHPG